MSHFFARARFRKLFATESSRFTTPGRQAAADRDLVHVDVGGVEEIAALGQREGGHRVGAGLGGQRGAFQRIDRDVHRRPAGTDFLANEQHRRFVHLALADDHRAIDRHRVERLAHGFDRRAVGFVLLTVADPVGCGQSRGFVTRTSSSARLRSVWMPDRGLLLSAIGFPPVGENEVSVSLAQTSRH